MPSQALSGAEVRLPLRVALRVIAAFSALAVLHAAMVLARAEGSRPPVASVAALYSAGHLLAVGVVLAGCAACIERWVPARRRSLAVILALAVLSGTASLAVMPADLASFVGRLKTSLSPALVRNGLAVAIAQSVPIAAAIGLLCARTRWSRPAASTAALALALANHRVLPADYPGVHLYLALCAGVLGAAALAGGKLPPTAPSSRARRVAGGGIAAATLAGGASIAVRPSETVSFELARHDGAVLVPYLARLHTQKGMTANIPVVWREWFTDRSSFDPIPPTGRLVIENPVFVLVTVDAMRLDVFESPQRAASLPVLTDLRKQSVEFTQARTPGSQTVYTITSIFTSNYYSQQFWSEMKHPKGTYIWPHADPSVRFTELLNRAGTTTVTFAPAYWFRNEWGVVRGFAEETWLESREDYAQGRMLTDAAVERLARTGDRPLFLYLHYMDAHAPHDRAGKRATEFESYVAELEYLDREIGRLRDGLIQHGLWNRTVLMISADHGQAFGEHGTRTHGISLYEELIHVPLLIRAPGVKPRKVDALVSLVDIGPTVLDISSIPTPPTYMGESLVPVMLGDHVRLTRPIVAETRLRRSLVFPDRHKAIRDLRTNTIEVYDLVRDPKELHNLVAEKPAFARSRIAILDAFFDAQKLRLPGYEPPWRP